MAIVKFDEDSNELTFSCLHCHQNTTVALSTLSLQGKDFNVVVYGKCQTEGCGMKMAGIAPLEEVEDFNLPARLTRTIVRHLFDNDKFTDKEKFGKPSKEQKDRLKSIPKANKATIKSLVAHTAEVAAGSRRSYLRDKAERSAQKGNLSPEAMAAKASATTIRQEAGVQARASAVQLLQQKNQNSFAELVPQVQKLRALATKGRVKLSVENERILAEAELAVRTVDIATVQQKVDRLLNRIKKYNFDLTQNSP